MDQTLWLMQLLFNVVMLAGLFVLARGRDGRPRARRRGPGLLARLRLPRRRRGPVRERKSEERREAPAREESPGGGAPLEVPRVLADLVAEAERREELAAERALRERLAAFRAREAS